MSHFRVVVFANDLEFDDLLAPYSEVDEQFFEFIPLREDRLEWLKGFFKENIKTGTFEEFLTEEGYVASPEDGSIGYFGNPNGKWDWYSENAGIDGIEPFEGEEPDCYGCYRKNQINFGNVVPYVFITPDGKWHAPGNIGWFALSDDTQESRKAHDKEWAEWIASPDNPYMLIVDCHI